MINEVILEATSKPNGLRALFCDSLPAGFFCVTSRFAGSHRFSSAS